MAETVQKQSLDLDNMENFEAGNDRFAFFDHFSKFSGLAVAQLYWSVIFLRNDDIYDLIAPNFLY